MTIIDFNKLSIFERSVIVLLEKIAKSLERIEDADAE